MTHELNDEIMRFVRLLKASAGTMTGQDRSSLLLLWPLLQEGPMRLRDLAEARGSDASTVSRQAAQLVEAGLVRRDPDPDDRRARLLAVTESGRGVCRQLIEARLKAIERALYDWDDDRLVAFLELFRDFNRAVEAHPSTAAEPPLAPGSAVTIRET